VPLADCVDCLSSVTFCIVAKRYVLAKNCLKEQIGNQGQKVDFWVAAIFLLPVSPLWPPTRPFFALFFARTAQQSVLNGTMDFLAANHVRIVGLCGQN